MPYADEKPQKKMTSPQHFVSVYSPMRIKAKLKQTQLNKKKEKLILNTYNKTVFRAAF